MLFARIVLIGTGILFALYGLACLLDPGVPARLIGVELGSAAGPVEFIAMYGGLQLALGIYLAACGADQARALHGLAVLAAITAGLGIARSIGLARLGLDDYNLYAACYELGTLAVSLLARQRLRRQAGG